MADAAKSPEATPPHEVEALPRPPPPPGLRDASAELDRELLRRLEKGDERAFAELLRKYQDRVHDLAFRMLGNRQEAEDLAQEIFVALYRNLGQFRGESKLSTWIFRVAKNHCLNRIVYLRRHGSERTHGLEDEREAGGDPAQVAPDLQLEQREQQALVQRALAELDEAHRMIVVLRDIEGLNYDEIVQVLDEPLGTVKSRLHRARAALAKAVARLDSEEAR